MAPGIELPQRTSRGKRIQQVLEDEGDENFWNQEFFAEEAQDIDYQESDEEEDVPDSDFDVSVSVACTFMTSQWITGTFRPCQVAASGYSAEHARVPL
jgi:hypothetical protein